MSIVIGLILFYPFEIPAVQTVQLPMAHTTIEPQYFQKPYLPAADTIDNGTLKADLIEIDKLIVDETISKAGHEFMEIFFSLWSWPQVSNGSFMMMIKERPFRGISTTITITINDLTVFESFLQTRYDVLESLAQMAAEQTYSYLMNYDNIMKQLEGKDMQGTGIY
ncbi:hypothetical protein C900_02162 [Fulvivirga imtechensis AK7]|uniref:Curli production assembly/transport component CsgE n=1 Tax=Fulvivirga imtechensis AK7 TaxID=1237149 RepID=L8JUK7_9BACT|nr:CsgE family curli-type amyloid fiber assembly protein [Fulvivirga imtechensis]ELR71923.1 hypothetical protein C900_02162 [Fulvivirga imtechensis AK7]